METLTPIREEIGAVKPAWLNLPGSVRYSSICRSKLYSALKNGEIRSVCLRDEGNVRGTRLINVASLDAYIAKYEGVWSQAPDKITAGNGGEH